MSTRKMHSPKAFAASALIVLLGLVATAGFGADAYKIMVYAGNGDQGYSGDGGPATAAALGATAGHHNPVICFDAQGNLLFLDQSRVRRVDSTGNITTVAGNGKAGADFAGEGGPATEACLGTYVSGLAVDAAGYIYIASYSFDRILKVEAAGTITTVTGTGRVFSYFDVSSGTWPRAWKVRTDSDGNLYFLQTQWMKRVDKAGTITDFTSPVPIYDFCVDRLGTMYVCDAESSSIYKIDKSGKAIHVAGDGRQYGQGDPRWYAGDGGPAIKATLCEPGGIDIDPAGNLYIADSGNKVIRKVDAAGIITTIAGGGYLGARSSEGGPATAIALKGPTAVQVDAAGNVYFMDLDPTLYSRIFKLYR